MSQRGHLHVRIQTSASPEQVFTVMRGLSARTDNLQRLPSIGVPVVGTRPPRFTIRAPAEHRQDSPVAWAGEVTQLPITGSLIEARTNRSLAIWRTGIFVAGVFAVILYLGSQNLLHGFWPLFGLCTLTSVVVSVGWTQATHLRERDRRDAFALLEALVTRLPDASLIQDPS